MVDRGANIDLFFRNGLRDYEVLPPPDIWDNIKPVLRKQQRSVILLRAAASVAVILSLGTAAYLFAMNLAGNLTGPAITLNQESTPEGIYIQKADNKIQIAFAKPVNRVETEAAEEREMVSPSNMVSFRLPPIDLFTPVVAENKIQKRNRNDFNISPELNNPVQNSVSMNSVSLSDLVASGESETGSDQVKSLNNWSIGAMVSPTYYSGFNLKNNDAGQDLVSSEKGVVSYSGGFSLGYNVNKRISIQTGIYYSAIGRKVTGIGSFTGFQKFFDAKSGSDFAVQTSSGTIANNNTDIYLMDQNMEGRVMTKYTLDVFDPIKSDLKYLNSDLLQNFNYLELPFVMRYKLIDRKVDFNLIGAISYNILVGNSAYVYADGTKYFLGKTDGLSPVTFSSSIGMGLEYNLSDRLSLNLEPTFRYYITPLGGVVGSSIHPYSFGILSGFSYKF